MYIHRAIQNLNLLVRLHHDHVTTGVNDSSAQIDDICRQLRKVPSAYYIVIRPPDIAGVCRNTLEFDVAFYGSY